MGVYTGLRGKVILKDEFVESIQTLNSREIEWDGIEGLPDIYLDDSRTSFIPFGVVCYMPADWDNYNTLEGNVWEFCCSLKNYTNTIEKFVSYVLPVIALSWDLESLYEENEQPEIFTSGSTGG